MPLCFRSAGTEDIDQLVEMRWDSSIKEGAGPGTAAREAFPGFAQTCGSFLRRILADPKWAIWVADLDGQIYAREGFVRCTEPMELPFTFVYREPTR